MDYRLLFTQRALKDLAGIIGHIAEDDAASASRFGSALLDHIDPLARFPRMGSATAKRGSVRKPVHSPVVVYSGVHDDRHLVKVLHIRHGARRQPRL